MADAWPSQSYFDTTNSEGLRVGYNGWESPTYRARTFYRMDIPSFLWGTDIISATLQTKVIWSPNTSTASVTLWSVGAISGATTWSNQPSQGTSLDTQAVAAHYSTDTNYPQQDFTMTSAVTSAAANHASAVTVGLFGDEANRDHWRKFTRNPTLAITYNSPPNLPANNVSSPSAPCGGTPYGHVGNVDVSLSAYLTDPDGLQNQLEGQFVLTDETTSTVVGTPTSLVNSGGTAVATFLRTTFVNNHQYGWKVRSYDGQDSSAYTDTCHFVVDQSAPVPPSVTSSSFPGSGPVPAARSQVTFTFAPGSGGSVPAYYVYALNIKPPDVLPSGAHPFPGGTMVTAAANGASTSVLITPYRPKGNVIYVYAINAAGSPSAAAAYSFTMGGLTTPDPVGDLTGDGKPDLLTVGDSIHPGLWLHPAADTSGHVKYNAVQVGARGTATNGTAADWVGTAVSVADLDLDGTQDVLVKMSSTPSNGSNVAIFRGTGDGLGFDPKDGIQVPLSKCDGSDGNEVVDQIVAVPTADPVIQSSAPDLYAVVGDALCQYMSSGTMDSYDPAAGGQPGWSGRTITGTSLGGANPAYPNDPAASADPALFVRDNAAGSVALYAGSYANQIRVGDLGTTVQQYASSGFGTTAAPTIAGGDLNVDGKPDLWKNASHTRHDAYVNNAANGFQAAVANTTQGGVLNDVNGDGISDVQMQYQYTTSHTALWTIRGNANGDGGFGDIGQGWDAPDWGPGSRMQAAGDFNGDGFTDFAIFYDFGGDHSSIHTVTATGNGSYSDETSVWDDTDWGPDTKLMAASDFNGDGKTDIALLYKYPDGTAAVFTLTADASGDGGFDAPVQRFSGTSWLASTTFLSAADVDGDARGDLVFFADLGGGHVSVFTLLASPSGDGSFSSSATLAWDGLSWGGGTTFMYTGDFNGDGRSDVALFYSFGGADVGLFTLTATAGTFGGMSPPAQQTRWTNWGPGTKFMSTGDYNGDGKCDLSLFYDFTAGSIGVFTLAAASSGTGVLGPAIEVYPDGDWGGGTIAFI